RYPMVHVSTAAKVANLFERWSATRGPSVRARNHAAKLGWLPPLAWDNIDNPAEQPAPVAEDHEMDEVAIERACAGQLGDNRLSIDERREAIRRMTEDGLPGPEIASRLHVNEMTIIRARAFLRSASVLAAPESSAHAA